MKSYLKDYPRPQFVRQNWENLNGKWCFSFDDQNRGESEQWYVRFPEGNEITVPFTYETKLSGIGDETRHDHVWYSRTIHVDAAKLSSHDYVLHFEGSDYTTKLWVNGKYAGIHHGGYSRFSFNITNLLTDGDNVLTVKVEDSFNKQQPRGKQRWLHCSFGCWYVQTTGIWKTVWAEYVPKLHLSYVKMTPDLAHCCLRLAIDVCAPENRLGPQLVLEAKVSYQGEEINRITAAICHQHTTATVDMFAQTREDFHWSLHLWTPDQPIFMISN